MTTYNRMEVEAAAAQTLKPDSLEKDWPKWKECLLEMGEFYKHLKDIVVLFIKAIEERNLSAMRQCLTVADHVLEARKKKKDKSQESNKQLDKVWADTEKEHPGMLVLNEINADKQQGPEVQAQFAERFKKLEPTALPTNESESASQQKIPMKPGQTKVCKARQRKYKTVCSDKSITYERLLQNGPVKFKVKAMDRVLKHAGAAVTSAWQQNSRMPDSRMSDSRMTNSRMSASPIPAPTFIVAPKMTPSVAPRVPVPPNAMPPIMKAAPFPHNAMPPTMKAAPFPHSAMPTVKAAPFPHSALPSHSALPPHSALAPHSAFAPHTALPSAPHTALPSAPHAALPSAPHAALPSAPHAALPSAPHALPSAPNGFCPNHFPTKGFAPKGFAPKGLAPKGFAPPNPPPAGPPPPNPPPAGQPLVDRAVAAGGPPGGPPGGPSFWQVAGPALISFLFGVVIGFAEQAVEDRYGEAGLATFRLYLAIAGTILSVVGIIASIVTTGWNAIPIAVLCFFMGSIGYYVGRALYDLVVDLYHGGLRIGRAVLNLNGTELLLGIGDLLLSLGTFVGRCILAIPRGIYRACKSAVLLCVQIYHCFFSLFREPGHMDRQDPPDYVDNDPPGYVDNDPDEIVRGWFYTGSCSKCLRRRADMAYLAVKDNGSFDGYIAHCKQCYAELKRQNSPLIEGINVAQEIELDDNHDMPDQDQAWTRTRLWMGTCDVDDKTIDAMIFRRDNGWANSSCCSDCCDNRVPYATFVRR